MVVGELEAERPLHPVELRPGQTAHDRDVPQHRQPACRPRAEGRTFLAGPVSGLIASDLAEPVQKIAHGRPSVLPGREA
ncbi:hypothetical protein [Micromonospora sp. DT47]|uniref:hypothetical protein n=1 Tax=Micromonospora sp. DT47 TaxID=3393431 RepID=UPI003CF868D7